MTKSIFLKIRRFYKGIWFRLFGSKEFDKYLVNFQNSPTYGELCKRVYGRDLCQLNMVDEEQLQKLIAVLNLNSSHKVLDLGCGVGRISEYISDVTGAHVTGVDYAKKTVQSANLRTQDKRDRLQFMFGNLNKLPDNIGTFDCVIAVDTLYFADDLESTIRQVQKKLKPTGKFATFYSWKVDKKDAQDQLPPESSKLASALKNCNLKFKTWNFTLNEEKIWQTCLQVSEELKESFIAEGSLDLYKSRIEESQRHMKSFSEKPHARYLYILTI